MLLVASELWRETVMYVVEKLWVMHKLTVLLNWFLCYMIFGGYFPVMLPLQRKAYTFNEQFSLEDLLFKTDFQWSFSLISLIC